MAKVTLSKGLQLCFLSQENIRKLSVQMIMCMRAIYLILISVWHSQFRENVLDNIAVRRIIYFRPNAFIIIIIWVSFRVSNLSFVEKWPEWSQSVSETCSCVLRTTGLLGPSALKWQFCFCWIFWTCSSGEKVRCCVIFEVFQFADTRWPAASTSFKRDIYFGKDFCTTLVAKRAYY